MTKQTALLTSCALFTCLWVHPASAQDDDTPVPAPAKSTRSSVDLTPAQLDGFAELTGEGQRAVAYRLSTNPKLVPLAAAAADARASRRSTGKIMAIVGFTILGVGDIVGTYIIMSTPGYPNVKSEDQGRVYRGLGIGVLSLAAGLALAIPGLIKMASPSEVEQRALDAYSQGWRDVSFQFPPPQVLGKTVASPVWSHTF